jgi:hypothetical protein
MSNKKKWTPGPWKAVLTKEGKFEIHRALPPSEHRRVPLAVIDHSRDGHEETRTVIAPEVAHLMAAAPLLYDALESLLESIAGASEDGVPVSKTAVGNANAALAAARGER